MYEGSRRLSSICRLRKGQLKREWREKVMRCARRWLFVLKEAKRPKLGWYEKLRKFALDENNLASRGDGPKTVNRGMGRNHGTKGRGETVLPTRKNLNLQRGLGA